jgi:hypothetical protein
MKAGPRRFGITRMSEPRTSAVGGRNNLSTVELASTIHCRATHPNGFAGATAYCSSHALELELFLDCALHGGRQGWVTNRRADNMSGTSDDTLESCRPIASPKLGSLGPGRDIPTSFAHPEARVNLQAELSRGRAEGPFFWSSDVRRQAFITFPYSRAECAIPGVCI